MSLPKLGFETIGLMFGLSVLMALAACGSGGGEGSAAPPAGTLSVTASVASGNGGGGSVRCSADGGAAAACTRYPPGTAIVVSAQPDGASDFSGWSGAGCTGTADCRFTLSADITVTANFSRPTLTVQVVGIGSVASTPVGITCSGRCAAAFDKGSTITLSASGSGFGGWAGAGCAGTGPCVLTLDRSISVSATFGTAGLPVFAQQAYLKASNAEAGDYFGHAVALSGDTLVVGAYAEASGATGIDGNQADNSKLVSGAVYVFTRSAGLWRQQAYLKASNTGYLDKFGSAVALAGDTLAVAAESEASSARGVNGNQADNSATDSGAVYVFTRTSGVWSQQAYLKASNSGSYHRFGRDLALDGDTLVVSAPGEYGGASGVNGNQADQSAQDSGAAYVFTRSAGVWSQQAYLKASNTETGDQFGGSVALSGDTVAVGAHNESSDAVGIDGDQANNRAARSGAVYVFTRNGVDWSQQAYVKASNTATNGGFGGAVALSGDTLVVGSPGESSIATSSGAAYVFTRVAGTWTQQARLKASNAGTGNFTNNGILFGGSLALAGDTLVVGAPAECSSATGVNGDQTNTGAVASGAVYAFTRQAGVWSQAAYLKASNTDAGDAFGRRVALDANTLAIGAWMEDSSATGVGGAQADNGAFDSGAVYVFTLQ